MLNNFKLFILDLNVHGMHSQIHCKHIQRITFDYVANFIHKILIRFLQCTRINSPGTAYVIFDFIFPLLVSTLML